MQLSKIVRLLFSIISCDVLSFAWAASTARPIALNATEEHPDPSKPCTPNPCKFGGTCVMVHTIKPHTSQLMVKATFCTCVPGYTGSHCEIPPTGCYDCGFSREICCKYDNGHEGCTRSEDCPSPRSINPIGGETMASGTPMPSLVSLPYAKHAMISKKVFKNVTTDDDDDDDDTDEDDEKDYSETVVTKKAEMELTQVFPVVTTTGNDVKLEEDEDSSSDETTGVASAIPTEKGNLENTTGQ